MKELIGYFYKESLNLQLGLNDLEKLKQSKILFAERWFVEELLTCVQPVCAAMIVTKTGKILAVNKSSKSTGKFSPEKDKTLLYVGGHLDISDEKDDIFETFKSGLKREVHEELCLNLSDKLIKNPVVVYTPTGAKSSIHMGIIFPVVLEKELETSFTDGKCKFVDIKEVSKIDNLEEWSKIAFKEISKNNFSVLSVEDRAK